MGFDPLGNIVILVNRNPPSTRDVGGSHGLSTVFGASGKKHVIFGERRQTNFFGEKGILNMIFCPREIKRECLGENYGCSNLSPWLVLDKKMFSLCVRHEILKEKIKCQKKFILFVGGSPSPKKSHSPAHRKK